MAKICFITGGRPDYGILFWPMRAVLQEKQLQFQLIVTGQHLSSDFGNTVTQVERDGFPISARVEMLLPSDSPEAVTQSLGAGVKGFASALQSLQPDLIVIVGDRFEILAAAQAALIARIPIAHISGGDTTEGAFDEAIRHSITKMSHLHFVTNEVAAQRVRQLGENPKHIFVHGNPGLDWLNKIPLLNKEDLEKALEFKLRERNLLVTFHPVTLEENTSEKQFGEILSALEVFADFGIVLTKANSDTHGRIINKMIDDWVSTHPNSKSFDFLGQLRYLSLAKQVNVVVGNSSSGLAEVPSLGKPTLNIGNRQKGRLQAKSVINCQPTVDSVVNGINLALNLDCTGVQNPYGNGNSSELILKTLLEYKDRYKELIMKRFYDLAT